MADTAPALPPVSAADLAYARAQLGLPGSVPAPEPLTDQVCRLQAENARLREALRPLAEFSDMWGNEPDFHYAQVPVRYGDLRQARALVGDTP